MADVVLAPGLLCDDRLWSAVEPGVAGTCQHVDFRSDGDLLAMKRRLLAEAPPRFVLTGFSMGGMVAMLAAAEAPERVTGLVLIDTHAEPETPERKARRARQIATALGSDFRAMVVNELKPAYFAPDGEAGPEQRRLVADMALDQGPGQFRRHVLALMSRPDPNAVLSRLTMPTTVVVGREDQLAPAPLAERLCRALPKGRLVTIENCGHMAPLEAPAVVAREINRLLETAPA